MRSTKSEIAMARKQSENKEWWLQRVAQLLYGQNNYDLEKNEVLMMIKIILENVKYWLP